MTDGMMDNFYWAIRARMNIKIKVAQFPERIPRLEA